jgi:aryl-alcohol dehydrogenase-like predicted oxidoreductase
MQIGPKIKARAKEMRIGPTMLGRMIKTSKQNVYNIFERDSIDTALLQKICKALEFDFFCYYSSGSGSLINEPAGYYGKNKKRTLTEDNIALRKDLKELREKYEILKELYETKTRGNVPGSLS